MFWRYYQARGWRTDYLRSIAKGNPNRSQRKCDVQDQPEHFAIRRRHCGGGIIAGAVAANANRPPQPNYPQRPAYVGNSAACQSWRYDAATRAQAQQIVSRCGLARGS